MPGQDNARELLHAWMKRLRESQFSYYEAAKSASHSHLWLGAPAAVLATLVATSTFATIGKSVEPWAQAVTGFLSVLAAVLAGLQTFLRFSETAEKHRAVAARYGSLRRAVEELLAFPDDQMTRQAIASLRERIDSLAAEALNVPPKVWERAQRLLSQDSTVPGESPARTPPAP